MNGDTGAAVCATAGRGGACAAETVAVAAANVRKERRSIKGKPLLLTIRLAGVGSSPLNPFNFQLAQRFPGLIAFAQRPLAIPPIASSYHDQCAQAWNTFIPRCGTKDCILFVPQSRQRIDSGRSPCRRIASQDRGA